MLDGFGAFEAPPPTARPAPAGFAARAKADIPPGFYGPPEGLLAVNTLVPADRLAEIDVAPLHARVEPFRLGEPQDLRGPIFLAALALLLLDAMVVFWLAGGIYRLLPRRRIAAVLGLGIALAALAAATGPSLADDAADAFARRRRSRPTSPMWSPATPRRTSISKAGLAGLTLFLAQRTALEAGEPIGLDLDRDELAFFPLIYWPIVPGRRQAVAPRRSPASTPT